MGIYKVQIKNFKSIKNVTFNFERDRYALHCLIGENGAGKSCFIDALCYFNGMLSGNNAVQNIMDLNNVYAQSCVIEAEYDFTEIVKNESNPYFDEKMKELQEFLVDGKMHIRMTQYKNGAIKWYPCGINAQMRRLLSKLFPVFCIDTRFIRLQDWNNLWEIIAELSIGQFKLDSEIVEKKIDDILGEIYGDKYVKTIALLKKTFDIEEIRIDDADYKNKYKNALIMRMGGNEFLSNENRLSFYSDGVNSFKFIRLVIELISGLANTGWKNPLLLIDEPEIGLHMQYIKELVECFQKNSNSKVDIVLSSHSPHLVTEMIKNEMTIGLWRVYHNSNCTVFEKIRDIVDENQKYMISDIETSCYFSKALVFVEGKSEMQLLSNKYIVELYPELKQIDVVRYDSDNSSLKLVYPDIMKFSIPYFTIVDMDKIISYSYKKNRFKVKSDSLVNPLYNKNVIKKQQYIFYNDDLKRKSTYDARRKIIKKLKEEEYLQDESQFYINDFSFDKLVEEIQQYCYEYRVIPLRTTIEGAIVSFSNFEVVIKWIKENINENEAKELDNILKREQDSKYRTTIVRCILNGKLDNLCGINDKGVKIEKSIREAINRISQRFGGKTGGWIGSFLEYYFQKEMKNKNDINKKRKEFEKDFPELNYVLHESIKMLQ